MAIERTKCTRGRHMNIGQLARSLASGNLTMDPEQQNMEQSDNALRQVTNAGVGTRALAQCLLMKMF